MPRLGRLSSLSSNATYVITGGSGGLAHVFTKWLVEQGAKHIILASRAATANEPTRNLIEELRRRGSNVVYHKCDVTLKKDVEKLVRESSLDSPPIRGVIHGAMDSRVGFPKVLALKGY